MKATFPFCWLTVKLLVCFVAQAYAQTEPGTFLVGTNAVHLGLNRLDAFGRRINSVTLKPALGLFVYPNLAIGLELPLSYDHVTDTPYVGTNTDIGISPFVRYYLGSNEWVKPFGSVTAGWRHNYNRLVNPADNYDDVLTNNSFLYGATAGLAFFLNQSVSFEVSANYADSAPTNRIWDNRLKGLIYDRVNVLSLRFGFQVHLGRDKHRIPCPY